MIILKHEITAINDTKTIGIFKLSNSFINMYNYNPTT